MMEDRLLEYWEVESPRPRPVGLDLVDEGVVPVEDVKAAHSIVPQLQRLLDSSPVKTSPYEPQGHVDGK